MSEPTKGQVLLPNNLSPSDIVRRAADAIDKLNVEVGGSLEAMILTYAEVYTGLQVLKLSEASVRETFASKGVTVHPEMVPLEAVSIIRPKEEM